MADRTPSRKFTSIVQGRSRGLVSGLAQLEAEKSRRVTRSGKVRVVEYSPRDEDYVGAVPPGSATLFLAPAGDDFLDRIAEIYAAGEMRAIKTMDRRIGKEGEARSEVSLTKAANELSSERVMADLRYGDKSLAENLGLPNGIPYGILPLPYNGGRLDDRQFSLVEYVAPGIEESLEAVVVKRPPILTEAETAALKAVPRDMLELNIGSVGNAAVTVTTVTIALFVVAMHTPTLGGAEAGFTSRITPAAALTEARLSALGPAASARELLGLRQEMLAEMLGGSAFGG